MSSSTAPSPLPVSLARMDGAGVQNVQLAEGNGYTSAIFRQTTQALGDIAKTRPDRYFGIMNMYPGKVYLVGGGVPLALDGQFFGPVGGAPACLKASTRRRAEPALRLGPSFARP